METKRIKNLLQKYFDGISSESEEMELVAYFHSDKISEELQEYTGFFRGISELSEATGDKIFEQKIMDFIVESEGRNKSHFSWLYYTVTGIAASLIIAVGGILFYQNHGNSYEDTFTDPQTAYAYAEKTLNYVSSKYNRGLICLSNFDKLQSATEPLQKGVEPVNEVIEELTKAANR